MKKLSSYQKLKQEKEEFENLYYKTRKKLHNLGEGIDEDDILMGNECEFPRDTK